MSKETPLLEVKAEEEKTTLKSEPRRDPNIKMLTKMTASQLQKRRENILAARQTPEARGQNSSCCTIQ